ncbi:hypothetical protein [Streptomyces sp. TRM49041]|uniref:hypothetical protein n=1 Tax=Streptomyces sp. TRM49041 TaxID=2603216 RepID=UPI0011F07E66|nr:hypothetical protein [Streptomyces sp. TRM49041]
MTPAEDARIGVRAVSEVESAYRSLTAEDVADHRSGSTARPGRSLPTELSQGAADAYEWALGRSRHGPVTGAPSREVPALWALTAEVDAAAVLLDDPVCSGDTWQYARGAHDALAWICGHSDRHV